MTSSGKSLPMIIWFTSVLLRHIFDRIYVSASDGVSEELEELIGTMCSGRCAMCVLSLSASHLAADRSANQYRMEHSAAHSPTSSSEALRHASYIFRDKRLSSNLVLARQSVIDVLCNGSQDFLIKSSRVQSRKWSARIV